MPLFTTLLLRETIRAQLAVPGDEAVEPLSFTDRRAPERHGELVQLTVLVEIIHVYFHTHLSVLSLHRDDSE